MAAAARRSRFSNPVPGSPGAAVGLHGPRLDGVGVDGAGPARHACVEVPDVVEGGGTHDAEPGLVAALDERASDLVDLVDRVRFGRDVEADELVEVSDVDRRPPVLGDGLDHGPQLAPNPPALGRQRGLKDPYQRGRPLECLGRPIEVGGVAVSSIGQCVLRRGEPHGERSERVGVAAVGHSGVISCHCGSRFSANERGPSS
jgi:hypothetical protein